MLQNIYFQVGMVIVKIFLKILETHLVVVFELPEVISLLLDGIICEVDELVAQVLKIKLPTARSNVTVLIIVALKCLVDDCDQAKNSEIKLPLVN